MTDDAIELDAYGRRILPDYVLSEAEDRARKRYITPSKISPWEYSVSQQQGLTVNQCDKLRAFGIDPQTVDWMWVTVPVPGYTAFDHTSYAKAVQKLACPIVRVVGSRIQVITPRGIVRHVYAGGRLSPPKAPKRRRWAA